MGLAYFVIGIEIFHDRSRRIFGLSQKTYINKVLERYSMMNCKSGVSPIIKGDKFSLNQCPKNDLERTQIKDIPYSSAVGSLMYAMTCTSPDISFAVGMLGRYVSNPGMDHWVAAKKVMRYLKRTREYMLTYRASDRLEVIGYSDFDYAGCLDSRKSTLGYIFLLAGGRFLGSPRNRLMSLLLLWKQSLWHALRPHLWQFGYGTLSQDFGLSTPFRSR
ncbi:secreted RxLR effector protein 161-like [Macadamia integrifolia]|uniref:secreted RxLR effector protein 161-like n=1 Tax=Macadamia integrifolia TaxID=60698 RepID=UPI001C4F5788|nr:secreted RxLR effector protein 161-like [Macadamia integrifolia]